MLDQFFGRDHFDLLPHLTALVIAYGLAFPIGWNREKEARSAGLRTFPLVAVAACGFVQASEALLLEHPDAMARVIEGIITGIGFIGAGAILRLERTVHGTATAASIWVTGAVGTSVGLGAYEVAGLLAAATWITLRLLAPLKDRVVRKEDAREAAEAARSDAREDS